jgi:multidrug efflux pump subunit AcrB
VPIVAADTAWTRRRHAGLLELQQVAHAIEAELKRVPGTREIYSIGGPDRVVRVLLDPQKLAAPGFRWTTCVR